MTKKKINKILKPEIRTFGEMINDLKSKMEKQELQVPSVNFLAEVAVKGARRQAYGHPKDEFEKVATIWGALLGTKVTAQQVGLCMAALKIVRQNHRPKRDNLVDICGYAKCVDLINDCV